MKPRDPKVNEFLNQVLRNELTAINQYFLHAKMFDDWGLSELAKHERSESIDEMQHAEALIDRILFLEGLPNLQDLGKLLIGQDVKEMLECDLALEMAAMPVLRDAIAFCEESGRLRLPGAVRRDPEVRGVPRGLAGDEPRAHREDGYPELHPVPDRLTDCPRPGRIPVGTDEDRASTPPVRSPCGRRHAVRLSGTAMKPPLGEGADEQTRLPTWHTLVAMILIYT